MAKWVTFDDMENLIREKLRLDQNPGYSFSLATKAQLSGEVNHYVVTKTEYDRHGEIIIAEGDTAFHEGDVRAWIDRHQAAEPVRTSLVEADSKNKGGRPRQIDWAEMMFEVVRIATTPDGLPETQSDLIKRLSHYFLDRYSREPSESIIKEKLSPLYAYLARRRSA